MRLYTIIGGSLFFYGWWNPLLLGVPLLLGGGAFFAAGWGAGSRYRLQVVIGLLLLPLVLFKYADFILEWTLPATELRFDLPLPLGISFITFTLIAYVVEVASGRFPHEANWRVFASYLLFFPHLIAGPILRPAELIPQLRAKLVRSASAWRVGMALFTVGLVKKLVIADQLAQVVEPVFAAGATPHAPAALLGILGFTVQIYCDFSGYTDMALGCALWLGIRLPPNFDAPYAANSVAEFWRRWHITLSLWLRDYLYIPLGGSRGSWWFTARNLMITMVLGGLWHGAAWHFAIWGGVHGAGIALAHGWRALATRLEWRLPGFIGLVLTFAFVALSWVWFRAPDAPTAWRITVLLFSGEWSGGGEFLMANLFYLVLIGVTLLGHRWDRLPLVTRAATTLPGSVLWPVIALGWLLAALLGAGSSAEFIYFDF